MNTCFLKASLILFISTYAFPSLANEQTTQLCDQAVEASPPVLTDVRNACLQAAEALEAQQQYDQASWYYLLAGKHEKNIKAIQPQLSEPYAYANIGASYLLNGQIEQVKPLYKQFLAFAPIPDAEQVMESDFSLLSTLYPDQQDAIKQGRQIWADLYNPFEDADIWYADYEKAVAEEQFTKAAEALEKIAHVQNKHQPDENLDRLDTLIILGILYNRAGQYPASIETLLTAEQIAQKLEHEKASHIKILHWLANAHLQMEIHDKAEHFYQQAIETKEVLSGNEHIELVPLYSEIAGFYHSQGQTDQTIVYYEKLKNIYIKNNYGDDIATVPFYDSLASIYDSVGDYANALLLKEKILQIRQQQQDDNPIDIAESYNSIGITYGSMGEHEKALAHYEKSLAIRQQQLGEEHALVGQSYNNIGHIYSSLNQHPKALEYYEKAQPLYENAYGIDHPETAIVYSNLALLHRHATDYEKSEALYKKVLAIRETHYGEDHPITADTYNDFGALYAEQNQYKHALPLYEKARSIREAALGKAHPDTATTYNNLGQLYMEMGKYAQALEYQNQALTLFKSLWGENHPKMAVAYNNLGSLQAEMGQYPQALTSHQRALNIRQQQLGEEHPDTATSYNNLGTFYNSMGDYIAAIEAYKKALDIRTKTLGKDHPQTAQMHNNLGAAYYHLGDNQLALEHYQTSLQALQQHDDNENLEVAIRYNNIGLIHEKQRQYDKALAFYEKSLAITKNIQGREHPDLATNYNNLSGVYDQQGDYEQALTYAQKALKLRQNVFGEKHPAVASSHGSLGVIYQRKKEYLTAKEHYEKALELRRELLGEEHIDTINTLSNLGTLLSFLDNNPKAYEYAKHAFDAFIKSRNNVFSALDSRQKNAYLKENTFKIGLLLNASSRYLGELHENNDKSTYQQQLQTLANDWLNYKGSLFDAENAIAVLYANTNDADTRKAFDELNQQKRALAQLYQSLPKPSEREQWQQAIKTTESQIADLNQRLSKSVDDFKQHIGLSRIETGQIAAQLAKDELYVDFARMPRFYYIFTIDHKNQIQFIQFDPESSQQVDQLIASFRKDIQTILEKGRLTTEEITQLTQQSQTSLGKLYTLLFDGSLNELLKAKNRITISADGALRLLPLEALYNAETQRYFIEEKAVRYISSGKELVRLQQNPSTNKPANQQETVVFANPDFDADLVSKQTTEEDAGTQRSGIIRSLFKMRFSPLAGTKAEADAIKRILTEDNLRTYEQHDANEAHLLGVQNPRILHIATHGFFLNDNTIPNPMLKSGVALAGANASAIRGKSNGIVTALKLSGMQLDETELVVLSACETGVVDPESTDSISGLSKAFIQAGADNIIMSLWAVADQETMALMKGFYTQVQTNKSYSEALRASKLTMIKDGQHPYYWAPFIINGGESK
jgi:tetratricopeptide (TPR) repeat protein/CHAT domain-containing protein